MIPGETMQRPSPAMATPAVQILYELHMNCTSYVTKWQEMLAGRFHSTPRGKRRAGR